MITLDHESRVPLYQQLYERFRDLIATSVYTEGDKLPPIRRLAEDLGISRNTVETAYLQLAQEGYVCGRSGSGFIVENLGPIATCASARHEKASKDLLKRLQQSMLWSEERDEGERQGESTGQAYPEVPDALTEHDEPLFDFTYGNLRKGSFPAQLWRKLTNEVLFTDDAGAASSYTTSLGERGLRKQIANYLHAGSGVDCHPAQVVIQAGTQASIYNLLTLFDPARDVVGMEEPGYDGVRSAFENARFHLFPLPICEGSDAFIESLYNSRARLVYVTPSNQFPTGQIYSMSTRMHLLRWASGEDAYIIEDDYCREFRYKTRPLPSLQSLDRDGRVIYMGTFSKALTPALRINYLVLPPELLFSWQRLFRNHYPQVPWLSQAVLQRYMEGGHWDRHLRRAQAENKQKYRLLIEAVRRHMGERVTLVENGSGLHLLLDVPGTRGQEELIALAQAAGVKVYGTDRYWMSPDHPMKNCLLVGFSSIPAEKIEPGIARLTQAWFG
ncbi:MAG: PLP-dependent aminotransferase family protein [Coriobacteriales bacterium]|jgi:GntR family transcriptional regulator/MocR family aminotransferase|nr:PLP-dependent aminotransferase family protein [Coriobacteriales bacterium]